MGHNQPNPEDHVPVRIGADLSVLKQRDREALMLLIEAVRLVNPLYLKQMGQAGEGPFDKKRPKDFYPKGISAKELRRYLERHPRQRTALMSPFTVIVRSKRNKRTLRAIPYSVHYRDYFRPISSLLLAAAHVTEHQGLRRFLEVRSKAFLSNKYRDSDIAWVKLSGSPIEIVIGPYESYEDKLFGIKRDVEGMLGIVRPEETANAKVFQEEASRFDAVLGKRYGYASTPTLTPMVVLDEVIAGGHPWYGYVYMASNLPNEQDIQREVGSKKIFLRNIIEAKTNLITAKIAERVLSRRERALFDLKAFLKTFFSFVIGHESSHGLSFHFDGEDFGPLASAFEECKADVFGLLFLYHLADKGVMKKEEAEQAVIAHLIDGLRQVRFDLDEAHALGVVIQYNWLHRRGAISLDPRGLAFKREEFLPSLQSLGDALYALAALKAPRPLQAFRRQWGKPPRRLRRMVRVLKGIPIDIDPQFSV